MKPTLVRCIKGAEEAPMINWREAFEKTLMAGGSFAAGSDCDFCRVKPRDSNSACDSCILNTGEYTCGDIFSPEDMDNSTRRAICRYVLKHGGEVINTEDGRRLIGEALEVLGLDEAREKFLRPEEKAWPGAIGFVLAGRAYGVPTTEYPELKYLIVLEKQPALKDAIIVACRDEDTRDRVLEFLNREE